MREGHVGNELLSSTEQHLYQFAFCYSNKNTGQKQLGGGAGVNCLSHFPGSNLVTADCWIYTVLLICLFSLFWLFWLKGYQSCLSLKNQLLVSSILCILFISILLIFALVLMTSLLLLTWGLNCSSSRALGACFIYAFSGFLM